MLFLGRRSPAPLGRPMVVSWWGMGMWILSSGGLVRRDRILLTDFGALMGSGVFPEGFDVCEGRVLGLLLVFFRWGFWLRFDY